jgi:hypothetical protein
VPILQRESPGAILSKLGGQETDDSDIALQGSILKLFGGGGRVQRPNPKKNMVDGTLMPELIINSPYLHSRVDSNTFTMGNPIPESTLTLCQS